MEEFKAGDVVEISDEVSIVGGLVGQVVYAYKASPMYDVLVHGEKNWTCQISESFLTRWIEPAKPESPPTITTDDLAEMKGILVRMHHDDEVTDREMFLMLNLLDGLTNIALDRAEAR